MRFNFKKWVKELRYVNEQRLVRGCESMISSSDPNCVKCFANSIGSFDPNLTGQNCECCDDEIIIGDPTQTDPCGTCCCSPDLEIGSGTYMQCLPNTQMMPASSPCDCESYGMIDDPDCIKKGTGTPPTVGQITYENKNKIKKLVEKTIKGLLNERSKCCKKCSDGVAFIYDNGGGNEVRNGFVANNSNCRCCCDKGGHAWACGSRGAALKYDLSRSTFDSNTGADTPQAGAQTMG